MYEVVNEVAVRSYRFVDYTFISREIYITYFQFGL